MEDSHWKVVGPLICSLDTTNSQPVYQLEKLKLLLEDMFTTTEQYITDKRDWQSW